MNIIIGSLKLKGNLLSAPMAGITDVPFRRLLKRNGASLVFSEMISSQSIFNRSRKTIQRSVISNEEQPIAIQLLGYDPKTMEVGAKFAEDVGASIIDINMGCPFKKIVNNNAGAALMKDKIRACQILEHVVKSVSVPVTLKMRTGWDINSKNAVELAQEAEKIGIKMITVHGRTRCQLYRGFADWNDIKRVKNAVKIPVIGNGDIKTVYQAKSFLDTFGVDGIMVGRGILGRPWFLKQIISYLSGDKNIVDPSLYEQRKILLEHFDDMLVYYGSDLGIKIARKHICWYSKNLPSSAKFRTLINTTASIQKVKQLIYNFYEKVINE